MTRELGLEFKKEIVIALSWVQWEDKRGIGRAFTSLYYTKSSGDGRSLGKDLNMHFIKS